MFTLVNFHAPGSDSAFLIRIRLQESQIDADPVPDPLHNTGFLSKCLSEQDLCRNKLLLKISFLVKLRLEICQFPKLEDL